MPCLTDICAAKRQAERHCPQCGGKGNGAQPCGACQQKPPPFDLLWASAVYEPPLSGILHAFKHQKQRALAPVLAEVMMSLPPPWLDDVRIDGVLAVPLSRKRRWQRGFNQCDELAERLAAEYGLPLVPHDAVFRRHRPPQSTLPFDERRRNLKNSFSLAPEKQFSLPFFHFRKQAVFQTAFDVKNRNLLLIDDVCTTNATLAELARMLRRSGVERIFCWTLAKGGMQKF